MSKFVFPPSGTSRPVWGTLEHRKGSAHLFIADAHGAEAILDLAQSGADFSTAHVIYIPRGETYGMQLKALEPAQYYEGPSYAAALQRIRHTIREAKIGLQFYVTGTEGLMGQAVAEAASVGIPQSIIQTEHRGSVARRMQCVHCKGITENVEIDPFVCDHCGLNLFVRDHYSRRLAAYQGVCVDAEDPGNIPEPKGIYE